MPAEQLWYTDWEAGVVARWDLVADAPLGVTQVGLSADLIDVGLGWVWVTDCMGGQLVRMDIASGEATGRIPVADVPRTWPSPSTSSGWRCPGRARSSAVHPETGDIVAEGTSDLDTIVFLEAGSLDAAGSTYYWKLDEVDPKVAGRPWSGDVWHFKIEDVAAVQAKTDGPILGLSGPSGSGNDPALLVGPPPGGPAFDDPAYTTQLMVVGPDGTLLVQGSPWAGFYGYLGAVGGHYLGFSKLGLPVVVSTGMTTVQVPMPSAGHPIPAPPPDLGQPPGQTYYWKVDELDSGPGPSVPWAWVGQPEPGNVVAIPIGQLNPSPVVVASPVNQFAGQPVGLWNVIVLGGNQIAKQAGLAAAMDPALFPLGIIPDDPTTPEGPRFSSCSVGYDSGERLLNGMEGTTDPGATVALSIEVGTLLYTDLATAVAGDDGQVAIPDFDLDDLTTPIPAGATITVVLTADGNDLGACRLEVET